MVRACFKISTQGRKPSEVQPKIERKKEQRDFRGASSFDVMRVLIVEDEAGLASALRVGLAHQGYAVDVALTCAEARFKLGTAEYDLLVLDANLPDGDGFSLAEAIRHGRVECMSGADVRILMLTARTQLQDRVRGLDVGADDYLVKPFALAELTARIRALFRREVRGVTAVLSHGPVRLDTARQLAHRGERELRLSRNVADAYRLVAEERSIRLDLRGHDGPTVYGDSESLERALSNLLSNAVRLAPEGSTIMIATGSREGWAWIAVRDEGPGIAAEEQERVFDRFHRGSDPSTRSTPGSGLGLAIARQIAESHEGRLVLFSRPGVGSTFVLWLPDRSLAPDRTAAPPGTDPLGGRSR